MPQQLVPAAPPSWTPDGEDKTLHHVPATRVFVLMVVLASGGCRNPGDYDFDGDGVTDAEDCAPEDAGVYPGSNEVCDDGVDQDCDGATDCHDEDCSEAAYCHSFMMIEGGWDFSCGVRLDGTAVCWGHNDDGQTEAPFASFSLGTSHGCGIQLDGAAVCWGRNRQGQTTVPP